MAAVYYLGSSATKIVGLAYGRVDETNLGHSLVFNTVTNKRQMLSFFALSSEPY